ncbi:MAG: XTP/dITP diphosphohydrolase [Gaiellaceae bacterium]|nr:XTP/dITP diphosphohydrolase [Gaiellaceae bacterium]
MVGLKARLASANAHKLAELAAALPGWELELLGAAEFPPEDGETYYENALGKARFGRATGDHAAWMLGEDAGIEVDGLGGEPGVRSARWADGDQAVALLERLGAVDGDGRRARMVTELVGIAPGGAELRGTGVLEGRIAKDKRGAGGFGYDPVFVPDGETRTVAELGDDWKRANSHRARAARALVKAIRASTG